MADWSATPVYVDLVRQARRFGSPDAPWDEAASIGADGWPVADFGVFLMTGQSRLSGTAGTYTVRFRGRAEIGVVASNARVARVAFDAGADRTTAEVVLAQGADQLALKFTATRGGVKDLQVIRPGYDVESPPLFTRALLDHLAPFGTLRFMDWLATNHDSGRGDWAARPTPTTVRHGSKAGVPWEHVIALANIFGKDVWINVPVRADDDYVRQLARRRARRPAPPARRPASRLPGAGRAGGRLRSGAAGRGGPAGQPDRDRGQQRAGRSRSGTRGHRLGSSSAAGRTQAAPERRIQHPAPEDPRRGLGVRAASPGAGSVGSMRRERLTGSAVEAPAIGGLKRRAATAATPIR